jgi:hypothetical protein
MVIAANPISCVLLAACVGIASAAPQINMNIADFRASNIIVKDVCVVGGGSSGTYAAIRLKDLGKSVVLVEREDHLGGHTATYTDPATNATIDYGVQYFHNNDFVKAYFARFDIPLTPVSTTASTGTQEYVDFSTGAKVDYRMPDPSLGLQTYAGILSQYYYLESGFNLPNPVPADLLLTFNEFVTKYSIQDFVPFAALFTQGLGNLLAQPMLYVFKNLGLEVIQDISIGFLGTARHDNSELYRKAAAELGNNALLSSTIIAMDRSCSPAKLLVKTPTGLKLILAKKLIFTVPPKIENLGGFDIDNTEKELFKQFSNSGYYTTLMRNTGIPDGLTISNTGNSTPHNLPALAAPYWFRSVGVSGLVDVKYGASSTSIPSSDAKVKADILASLRRFKSSGVLSTATPESAEFIGFHSHTPFELTVPKAAIAAGFYTKLYALQGRKNTWWTGAAWHTHDSSSLWIFTEGIVQSLVAAA